jgi:hypothetical protein
MNEDKQTINCVGIFFTATSIGDIVYILQMNFISYDANIGDIVKTLVGLKILIFMFNTKQLFDLYKFN